MRIFLIVISILGAVAFGPQLLQGAPSTHDDQDTQTMGGHIPYLLYGYTLDSGGAHAPNCNINITDKNSLEYNNIKSDGSGYYQYNLGNLPSGYDLGDTINVTANNTLLIGYNETTVTGAGGKWFNVTLGTVIPEFSEIIVPIAGLMLIALIFGRVRKKP